ATGYIFPKSKLLVSGVNPQGIFAAQDFYGTHDAVCKAVLDGKADVGATFSDDPVGASPAQATGCVRALGQAASSLRIIGATDELPNDVVALRPQFPAELETKLLDGLQAQAGTEAGRKRLLDAFLAEGFTSVSPDDYAPVRQALDAFKE
ncbi:MAG: phosphate/phosphite/phosphonate ABC transporter substrate-binding protein, partial [Myxococcales bacterium]